MFIFKSSTHLSWVPMPTSNISIWYSEYNLFLNPFSSLKCPSYYVMQTKQIKLYIIQYSYDEFKVYKLFYLYIIKYFKILYQDYFALFERIENTLYKVIHKIHIEIQFYIEDLQIRGQDCINQKTDVYFVNFYLNFNF